MYTNICPQATFTINIREKNMAFIKKIYIPKKMITQKKKNMTILEIIYRKPSCFYFSIKNEIFGD